MKTCGTCKYRGEPITFWDYEVCDDITTSYFACERIKHDKNFEGYPGLAAKVRDGSGYMARLCVESDFGCSLWEPKEDGKDG